MSTPLSACRPVQFSMCLKQREEPRVRTLYEDPQVKGHTRKQSGVMKTSTTSLRHGTQLCDWLLCLQGAGPIAVHRVWLTHTGHVHT
ncbi:hypothetical protein EYF80_058075 [Liparis tanakae]|uniref:Uncharacterized protein n=1 Tax=Liparis tanakae TaxID=230148 RepID=A0A4Z2ESI1_9TELE|nr:hypothetical protein EYF80_058075 [Liparis tanakae]